MTQTQLIQHISAFDKNIKVVKLRSKLKDQSFTLSELVDLTFYPDKAIAVKASHLLETMLMKFPENYCGEIAYLIERMPEVKCQSCKRYYAKIVMHLTSPEVPREVRNTIKEIDFDRVVELCFDWMIDTTMLTRVRASASEALFNLRHRFPWIAEELSKQLEYLLREATPTIAARGNMILSYLHCED